MFCSVCPKHYLLWLINDSYLNLILANANINLYILDPKEPFWSRGATPQLSKVAIGHFRFTLLNLSVFEFSFVYHDKVKWTQQRNLLHLMMLTYIVRVIFGVDQTMSENLAHQSLIFDTDENPHFLLWSQHHSWSKRVGWEHTGSYSSIQAIGVYIKSRKQFMKMQAGGVGGSHLY